MQNQNKDLFLIPLLWREKKKDKSAKRHIVESKREEPDKQSGSFFVISE